MAHTVFRILLDALESDYGHIPTLKLARELRVTPKTIQNWKANGQPSAKNLRKILELYRDHHAVSLVRPITEFHPIYPTRSGTSWRFGGRRLDAAELKEKLTDRIGLYVFYDSSGHAVYVGKTERCLYTEAKQRLAAQPNQPTFFPGKTKDPRVGGVARYVSAYRVSIGAAIKNLETLLLRAFTNDLRNKNRGSFKSLRRRGWTA